MHRKGLGTDGWERLERFEAFAQLSAGQRRMLARVLDELTAEEGEELVHEGELGHDVAFLEQGGAEVYQQGAHINTIGPGDVYGELAVLDGGAPRSATIVAASPLRAIIFTSNAMHTVRQQMPDVASALDLTAAHHRELDRSRQAGEATG